MCATSFSGVKVQAEECHLIASAMALARLFSFFSYE